MEGRGGVPVTHLEGKRGGTMTFKLKAVSSSLLKRKLDGTRDSQSSIVSGSRHQWVVARVHAKSQIVHLSEELQVL